MNDINNELMRLYNEGLVDKEIANVLDCSKSYVTKWRKKNNLEPNYNKKKEEEYTERFKLYNQGLTDNQISELTGANRDAIRTWRRRNRLPANNESDIKNNEKLELYKKGYNDTEIGRMLNLTESTIYEWRKNNNLPSLNNIMFIEDAEEIKQIEDLYNLGYSDSKISNLLNKKSSNLVSSWRKDNNLPPNGNETLEDSEHNKRLYYYNQGMYDHEIAEKLGNITSNGISCWRRRNNLPPHVKRKNKYNKNKGIPTLPKINDDMRLYLYKKGMSDVEIGQAVGVQSQSIAEWRYRRKLIAHNYDRSITQEEHIKRLKLYCKGMGDDQIAEQLNVTPPCIRGWRIKNNLEPNYNDNVNRCIFCLTTNNNCSCNK